MSLSRVSLVVPSYNGRPALARCLATLEREARDAEVIVVDGGSSDGSREEAAARPVRLLEVSNFGWAHATNRGFEAATRPVLVTLNSDAYPARPALLALREALLDPRVGAAAPLLLNEDGSRQAAFGLLGALQRPPRGRPQEVSFLHGACLATRRDVLVRVGGFDENFFLYNEEFDWCLRARAAGYRLLRVPQGVVHSGGASSGRSAALTREGWRGGRRLLRKHAPAWVANVTGVVLDAAARLAGPPESPPFSLSGRGEVRYEALDGRLHALNGGRS